MKSFFISLLIVCAFLSGAPAFGVQPATADGTGRKSVIEGKLTLVSKLPEAQTNAYPDCYFTAVLETEKIISGESLPKKIVLVLPGFFDRKYAPDAQFKVGDTVRATVVPFASMPDKVRQTQQADEVDDVDLEFFFPLQIATVKTFSLNGPSLPFAEKTTTKADAITPLASDEKAQAARREQIQNDLNKINSLLAEHGGDWGTWYRSLEGFRSAYAGSFQTKAGRWIGDSFFSAGYFENGQGCSADFVQSVIKFKKYLKTHNVDLILVRVPKKGEVVDDFFSTIPGDGVTNPYLLRMYKELLQSDVEIITDITASAKKQRFRFPLMYWYQDFEEDHPAEGIAWVIAEELATRVKRYERVKAFPKKAFNIKEASATAGWLGHRWPAGNSKFNPAQFVKFKAVMGDDGNPLKLKQGMESPVVILGSSFIATPSLSKGASIPHYFAYLTGVTPDLVYRNDADFMMPRSVAREGYSFLTNRSVFLFPFTPFTPYKALASIPVLDPQRSVKEKLSYLKGPELKAFVHRKETSNWSVSVQSDVLELAPPKNNDDNSINLKLPLPPLLSRYKHYIVWFDLDGKDRTTISAQYESQNEKIKRSETQENSEESFIFLVGSGDTASFEFTTDSRLRHPVKIKGISIYGVKKPVYYVE